MKPLPKSKELNVCGWQAVSTLFARHPDEVLRLFFDATTGKRAGEFCSLLATRKKVYRQVDGAELDRIAGSKLHGGIIAVIAERPLKKVTREVMADWARAKAPLLLLDRVSNANNVGAIVRTAAFFGVKAIIVPDHPAQGLPGEAAWRVAEGGMEFVDFYRVPALPAFCAELKRSHALVGTSLRGNQLSPREARERGLLEDRHVGEIADADRIAVDQRRHHAPLGHREAVLARHRVELIGDELAGLRQQGGQVVVDEMDGIGLVQAHSRCPGSYSACSSAIRVLHDFGLIWT